MTFCASDAAIKKKKSNKNTVDKEAQHLHIVCRCSLSFEDEMGVSVETVLRLKSMIRVGNARWWGASSCLFGFYRDTVFL